MKIIAQILYDKAHYIFEAEEVPDWPPYPDGEIPLIIDITNTPDVQEGWDYDPETGEFAEPEYIPPEPGPEPEPMPEPPTEQELIQAAMLLNQTQILINQDQQDTVLAELLLNQIGGI